MANLLAPGYSDFTTIPDIETAFNTEEGKTVPMKRQMIDGDPGVSHGPWTDDVHELDEHKAKKYKPNIDDHKCVSWGKDGLKAYANGVCNRDRQEDCTGTIR